MLKTFAHHHSADSDVEAAWPKRKTPRKGGTIRLTAPYGSSFANLDIHTSNRAQDEIFGKAIHRSLYNWDSANNKPVLELAKDVTVSADGLVHTFKLRDDALFHHGRKMTADDMIWTFNRLMDGSKAYPGARYVRLIKGAVEVEKGQAKEISGLKKIDDFTLEMTLTEQGQSGLLLFTATTSIYPADEAAKDSFRTRSRSALARSSSSSMCPGSRIVLERWEKFYKPGKPYADKFIDLDHGRGGGARRRLPQQGNRHLDPGPGAIRRLSGRSRTLKGPSRSAGGVHPPHGHEPELQAVRRQAGAAGDQLCHRRPADHQAAGQGQGLSRHQLAADHLAGLRQEPEALCLRSGEGEAAARRSRLSATASSSNGPPASNESWGMPIVEAVIPMLDKVGIKVKVKQVEGTVLAEIVRKGEYQAYIWSKTSGPDPLDALKCFHSATPQSACNYTSFKNADFDKLLDEAGRPTTGQADRAAEEGQRHRS